MIPIPNQSEIILYKTEDGAIKIDTIFQNETIWLTQKKMAELFNVNIPAISKHLSNIFEEGGLQKETTISKKETVQFNSDLVGSILNHATQSSDIWTNCSLVDKEVL